MAVPPAPRISSHLYKALLGYAVAAVCLVWVFHDVRPGEMFRNLGTINWWWITLAIVADILSYVCQGLRWSLLLHPRGRLPTARAIQAIYAGLFVNEILPMRVGEVLRVYLASRWLATDIPVIVSSVLVERFFDGIWLALAVGLTLLLIPLPRYLVHAEEFLAVLVFAATAVFVCLVMRRHPTPSGAELNNPPSQGIGRRFSRIMKNLAVGLRDIGGSRYFYESFTVSCFLLVFQVLAFWLVMYGYGLPLTIWHGAAILLIVHLGTAIPSAPSNIGTYQFFTVLGLTQFGIDKTLATGFSVVVFLILTIPLWLIGLFAFGHAGMSLHKIRTEMPLLGED